VKIFPVQSPRRKRLLKLLYVPSVALVIATAAILPFTVQKDYFLLFLVTATFHVAVSQLILRERCPKCDRFAHLNGLRWRLLNSKCLHCGHRLFV
jgi:hypothetical protein